MSDAGAIIARLEKATGPDREIDYALALACKWTQVKVEPRGAKAGLRDPHGGYHVSALPYTASIDAALTLVPEKHGWNVGITDEHYKGPIVATAEVLTLDHLPEGWRARGASPAIALCIAALKARSAALTQPTDRSASE